MIINYQLSVLLGIGAFVFSYILTEPNAILNKPYLFLYKLFKTDERNEQGRPIHPLFMVLIYCEKCVAGQWALWTFFFTNWRSYFYELTAWLILQHVLFILFTIFSASVVKLIYTNKEKKHGD